MAIITQQTKQNVKRHIQEQEYDELAKFHSLSKVLRDFIVSTERIRTMSRIAKDNGMADERANTFKNITTSILSGRIPITKYKEILGRELNIDIYTAHKIAVEVRNKIFAQVTDELRKIHKLDT